MRFSDDQRRTLASVLDEIIPPSADGRLPGAGALGLDAAIAEALRAQPELAPAIDDGIATADALARERHGRPFAALAADERTAVFRALDAAAPAFVPTLTFQAYLAYYQDPRVTAALGIGTEPPHPGGYEMEENDLSLLEPVRRRGKLYRDV